MIDIFYNEHNCFNYYTHNKIEKCIKLYFKNIYIAIDIVLWFVRYMLYSVLEVLNCPVFKSMDQEKMKWVKNYFRGQTVYLTSML